MNDLAPQQVSVTLPDDQPMEILLRDVLLLNVGCFPCSPQYVEAISSKQTELDNYIAEGYKNALSEERRRYCFLVDRQCAVAKNSSSYHSKVGTRVRLGEFPRPLGGCLRLTAVPAVAACFKACLAT